MPSRRKSASGRRSSCPSWPKRSIRKRHLSCPFGGTPSSQSRSGTVSSSSLKKNTGASGITALPIFAFLRTRVKRRQLRPRGPEHTLHHFFTDAARFGQRGVIQQQ